MIHGIGVKFPRYLMKVGTEQQFLAIEDASMVYDFGHLPVQIVGLVLESTYHVRDITDEERGKIVELAEEYSANK